MKTCQINEPTSKYNLKPQKIALLKRNRTPTRLSGELFIKNHINREIDLAIQTVKDKYSLTESEMDSYIFSAKVKVIEYYYKNKIQHEYFLQKYWPEEYDYLTSYIFPRKWMKKQKSIKKTFDRYKNLAPILNCLQELAKKATTEERREMDMFSNSKKYKDYQVSCFLLDSQFYKKVEKICSVSRKTVRRHINELLRINALKLLAVFEGNTQLVSFGYYVPFDGRSKHVAWLKNTKFYKEQLRNFHI